jgi:hypothetical protein
MAMRLCRSDGLSSSDGWKAFTIFTAANVTRKSSNATESQQDLWLRLKADVQTKSMRLRETLTTLVNRAGDNGLAMSEIAAEVIQAIAQIDSKQSHDTLHCIVPLIHRTAPTEIPRLRSWIEQKWQAGVSEEIAILLSRHAALLMAEHSSVLEPAWVRPVVDLAHHGDDRSKTRAALVLGGPVLEINRIRRRIASVMGFDSIKQIALCIFHECVENNVHSLRLLRCFDDVHFDHREAAHWLKECPHPEAEGLNALSYFFGYGAWSGEALDAFAQWLIAEPACWQEGFIIGYGCLSYHSGEAVPASLHSIMRERIESWKVTAHLLPETESYAIVIDASLASIGEVGVGTTHDRASAILDARCECLRTGVPVGSLSLVDTCAALALSNLQWFDTFPEDCWQDLQEHMDNDQLFDLIFHWLVKELKDWSTRSSSGVRPTNPSDAYKGSVRNALLSILCVMTERKRDEFVLLANELEQRGQRLSTYLAEAAVYHGKGRARMAAITLLSRLPNLDANLVTGVVQAALGDDERVRSRALMLIPHFREFNVTDAFLDEALAKVRGNESASVVLAYAKLLTNLLNANQVRKAEKRREILTALRNAANDMQNIRMISHLAGSGTEKSPRIVVNDGRLDQELLAVMAKSYSNFFKNA